jgi:hypothetical protein
MPYPKPLLEIILILSLTILVLGFYSFTNYEINFAVEIKKNDLKTFFTPPTDKPFLFQSLDSAYAKAFKAVVKPDSVAKVDSSGHSILLTGDSMCEGLMFRFKDYAEYNKHQLKTVIWYGSTTLSWGESDSLKKLIEKYKPSYVIFTTGSNELFIRNIGEREKHIQDIVNQMGNRKFIWIGPPNWTEDTGINDLIAKNVGADRFFISKHLKFDRANDGAHPTFRSAAVWADTISAWIMHKSRHKILMQRPKKSAN